MYINCVNSSSLSLDLSVTEAVELIQKLAASIQHASKYNAHAFAKAAIVQTGKEKFVPGKLVISVLAMQEKP